MSDVGIAEGPPIIIAEQQPRRENVQRIAQYRAKYPNALEPLTSREGDTRERQYDGIFATKGSSNQWRTTNGNREFLLTPDGVYGINRPFKEDIRKHPLAQIDVDAFVHNYPGNINTSVGDARVYEVPFTAEDGQTTQVKLISYKIDWSKPYQVEALERALQETEKEQAPRNT